MTSGGAACPEAKSRENRAAKGHRGAGVDARTIAFCWIYPLEATRGGVERVTLRLMGGLVERGYKCLFIRHDLETNKFLADGHGTEDLDTLLCRHSVDILINQNGQDDRVARALEVSNWRGRLVVCHHVEPMYLRKIYDRRGVIKEIANHASPIRVRVAWLARLLSYPVWQSLSTRKVAATQLRNYQRADRYVILSPRFLPELKRLLGRTALPKVTAIPNPLSFEVDPSDVYGYKKRREVLIVSRLSEGQKRISAALAAWRTIESNDPDGWVLKIVGDGPNGVDLQQMARKLGLKRVQFLGQQDPLPHYHSAAIFFLTSRVEGWGLTLTEAMQTGVVPVAFDAYAALRDIIDDGETGILVRNGDVASFAKQSLRLMQDIERRQMLANKAIASAQRFRLQQVLDQWEAIL